MCVGVCVKATVQVDVDELVFLRSGVDIQVEAFGDVDVDGIVLLQQIGVGVDVAAVEVDINQLVLLRGGTHVQVEAFGDIDFNRPVVLQQISVDIRTPAQLDSNRVPNNRRVGIDIVQDVDVDVTSCECGRVQ